jgi:hypothetical protein
MLKALIAEKSQLKLPASFQLSSHSMLGKTALTRKLRRKVSHPRAKFNGRPKLPGWPGKRWHSSDSGPGMALIEGGD